MFQHAVALLCTFLGTVVAAKNSKPPNFLFILTDDQDWHMESMKHMPFLQKYLLNEGTLYSNHYCTVALCCPSRVNLWTGRAAHNTNVTDVWAPYGGYPKVVREGINENYLPVWLQDLSYNTYYSGKLWNQHSVENYDRPFAGGFNGSDFVLDPYTYQYWNASMSRNGAPPVNYEGQYSPDVTANKAYGFLEEALSHPDPWFLVHAPIAPHGDIKLEEYFRADMPGVAKRHQHLFKEYQIPRDENFNPDVQGGVSWVKNLPKLNQTVIEYNDEYQRARLRALQSVDEMVEKMVKMLEAHNQLDNTYIFYTTDNGYHISQHRMHPGKECGFETDVHIPLIIRGPGVEAGHVSNAVTAHTDVASTIMQLAGGQVHDTDGTPIPLSLEEEKTAKQETVTIEYWGLAIPEGLLGWYGDENMTDPFGNPAVATGNNTYKAVRVIGEGYNFYYAVWCTNEKELYDLKTDPGEMHNLLGEGMSPSEMEISGRPLDQVSSRLDTLMMVLKSCKGNACTQPWREIHPAGDVKSLVDSLDPRFDEFYQKQPRVSFSKCELGYIPESEGAMDIVRFGEPGGSEWKEWMKKMGAPVKFRYQGDYSLWT